MHLLIEGLNVASESRKKIFHFMSDISMEVDETIHLCCNDEKVIFVICKKAMSVLKDFNITTLNTCLHLTELTANFLKTSCRN
jgi:hypothetical protein